MFTWFDSNNPSTRTHKGDRKRHMGMQIIHIAELALEVTKYDKPGLFVTELN
jgi:hypothetical protein